MNLPDIQAGYSSLQSFPGRFEAYFNDHFGLREQLVSLHHFIYLRLLNQSPVNNIILGRNDWLFLKTPAYGKDQPSALQLQAMKLHLETKQQWLAKRQIQYLFLPAPNKQSIYPEYLPEGRQSEKQNSQLDHLLLYLGQETSADILDVRSHLRNVKQTAPVYHRTDHHWNDRGALIAYQTIINTMAQWFPGISPPLSLVQMHQQTVTSGGMSLANMMGLAPVLPETYTKLTTDLSCAPKAPYTPLLPEWIRKARSNDEEEWYRMRLPLHTVCPGQELKVIVFRDSFFDMIIPFFSTHFQEAVYIWSRFDYSILEDLIPTFQPDIVIEECVESEIFLSHIPTEIHKTKGFDYLIAGKKQKAIQEFKKDLVVNPYSADSYNNLGIAFLQVRDFDGALNMFESALKCDPTLSKATINYERTRKTVIIMDQEIKKTKDRLWLEPKNADLNVQLGVLLQKRGRPELAIKQYRIALDNAPDNFFALNNLAAANAVLQRYDKACEIYQQMTRIYPEKGEVYYNLACLYSIRERVPEAVDSLKKAIQKGYDNFQLLQVDHDLDNIRHTSYYKTLQKNFAGLKIETAVVQ